MTAAEAAFRRKLEQRAARLSGDLRGGILRAWEHLRASLSEAQLAAFIRSNSVEALLSDVVTEEAVQRAFLQARSALRTGVEQAGQAATRALPAAARGIGFDILSQRVVDGINQLNSRVMTTLVANVRESMRVVVRAGLEAGLGPRDIARDLRRIVGLAPNQVQAVANYRGLLEVGSREALSRQLRDRRFDSVLNRALGPGGSGLSEAQIDRMSLAYERRFLAFNAEVNARTAALDAQKLGQQLTFADAIDRGDLDGERLMKRWSSARDDRVRPTHQDMEGEVVRFDEPFSNGQDIPGEDEFNCRCIAIYFTVRDADAARKPGVGAALEAPPAPAAVAEEPAQAPRLPGSFTPAETEAGLDRLGRLRQVVDEDEIVELVDLTNQKNVPFTFDPAGSEGAFDAFFHKGKYGDPVFREVRVADLQASQQTIDATVVRRYLEQGAETGPLNIQTGVDRPTVVSYRGKLYLVDGHHRATAFKLAGRETITVRFVGE